MSPRPVLRVFAHDGLVRMSAFTPGTNEPLRTLDRTPGGAEYTAFKYIYALVRYLPSEIELPGENRNSPTTVFPRDVARQVIIDLLTAAQEARRANGRRENRGSEP